MTLINWQLVGTGTAYPTCGDTSTWSVHCGATKHTDSQDGHTHRIVTPDCHRLACPIDYDKEVWRRSQEAAERLGFVKKSYYLTGVDLDYVEVIAYPPKDKADWCFGTQEGYKWMTGHLKALHEDFGILGGLRVIHITAVNRSEGATYAEYEKYRKGEPSKIRHNPHIQEIALRRGDWGRDRAKAAKWQAKGWFVRVLYADGRTENRPWNSLARKISYEMSHAYTGTTDDGSRKQFTTWFGIVAYNNVHKKVEIVREEELCKCGQVCFQYFEDEKRDISIIKRREFTYWLTDGAIDRAIAKYGLERGAPRAETLDIFLSPTEAT